jgi:hypothetical protein
MIHPIVFVAILAKQKETMLPAWLDMLSKWDYPKDRIILYIRSNNNTDKTQEILHAWANENAKWYRHVVEDYTNVEVDLEQYEVHEWNATRFKVLGAIRERSVELAWQADANFYFVCDVDNFIEPHTLSTLVSYNLPVVAPLLYSADPEQIQYSNYHNIANSNGYYQDNPAYYTIWNGDVRGLIKCDVVHCTYLIRGDIFTYARYMDGSDDYEYVIFSRFLRQLNIPQYLDNTQLYGWLSTRENLEAIQRKITWQQNQLN